MTGGEAHEVKGYDALMELCDLHPEKLLGGKCYDSDEIRDDLAARGIEPVIPPRSNRKASIAYDLEAYKRRNLIERCVNRFKQFRRVRNTLRENRQSLRLHAMHRSRKALDQNCKQALENVSHWVGNLFVRLHWGLSSPPIGRVCSREGL